VPCEDSHVGAPCFRRQPCVEHYGSE
jgi:hypothetical protein